MMTFIIGRLFVIDFNAGLFCHFIKNSHNKTSSSSSSTYMSTYLLHFSQKDNNMSFIRQVSHTSLYQQKASLIQSMCRCETLFLYTFVSLHSRYLPAVYSKQETHYLLKIQSLMNTDGRNNTMKQARNDSQFFGYTFNYHSCRR